MAASPAPKSHEPVPGWRWGSRFPSTFVSSRPVGAFTHRRASVHVLGSTSRFLQKTKLEPTETSPRPESVERVLSPCSSSTMRFQAKGRSRLKVQRSTGVQLAKRSRR